MDIIERFCGAVKIKTDWPGGALPGDAGAEAPLFRFQDFLAEAYPHFHKAAERWALGPYSLIYRWPGAGAGSPAPEGPEGSGSELPALILAHYDVVPVEEKKWTADPFGAEIRDGFVYGRGTLDMKGILIGIMEGAETLCAGGFRPRRDIWFAFGGDEERAGVLGAQKTARWFAQRGLRFSWILDEGTPVGENQIPGIDTPLALFGIEEKGFLSLDLRVAQQPGHASRPPSVQAAAVLARALCRIAEKPFPFRLVPTVEQFFTQLSGFASGPRAFFMRHARALGPLFFKALSSNADIASMLHTTVAMTQLEGSAADNVMPSEARAVINLRLLQPWTVPEAIGFIKRAVNDDRVDISIHGLGTGPVPANPEHTRRRGPGWKEMETALGAVYPGIPALVFVMVATTDSRHYQELAGGIFRFSPHRLGPRDLSGIHGHDERISLENLRRGAEFYRCLLRLL
ncbi:MAG: M20/M25/M40 family metallo-hydrolase [Treponema sp.]|jgi:carboxypeptidase PM20D1|nr:M20/M25/M40 family metallo-hydrolase [Treponema sp.]